MSANDIILGIDLGTTFSLVAYADQRGPRIIRDAAGEGRVPSVLGFGPDGRVTVGWHARRHAIENPERTVYSIKRLMGLSVDQVQRELPALAYHVVPDQRGAVRVQIDRSLLAPEEISSLILRELKARADAHFGRPTNKAVITVPAYFDDAQRQATRHAGRIAGLDVVRIVNEPTAAALAYGLGTRVARTGAPIEQVVAVYDLGGGTFDVSILRLAGDVFEVVSTHGDTHLGGDDFDQAIIALVQREVAEQFAVDLASPAIRQALRTLAEEIKIRLSDAPTAAIELDLGDRRTYRRDISRDEFERLILPFIERTLASCRQALKDAKLEPPDIDQVVLVGGSSRIPLVRRRVEELFGKPPYTALDPDEVVALGAAVQGQILAGGRADALLLDVTPLSLGIETMGGAMGKLIMRNSRIPCRAVEQFTTFVDGQTSVKINVLQGERELAADCRSLATFDLRGLPPMPAGMPKIDVEFLIDANGILNVAARELRTGTQAGIQVIPSRGLTPEEAARIEADAIRFARQDMTAHRLIDLRNQVAYDTHKTEQTLARYGPLLPDHERAELEAAMRSLREQAQATEDAPALHAALDEFGRKTLHLANLAITEALREAQSATDPAPVSR